MIDQRRAIASPSFGASSYYFSAAKHPRQAAQVPCSTSGRPAQGSFKEMAEVNRPMTTRLFGLVPLDSRPPASAVSRRRRASVGGGAVSRKRLR